MTVDGETDDLPTPSKPDGAQPDEAWHAGFESELSQLVTRKGWRSPQDVVSSYQNLERLVGGDRLSLPARDAGADAWAPVWEKLGRPMDAAGYALVAPTEGNYDPALADWFRETAFTAGLTDAQARQLHDAFLARFAAPAAVDAAPTDLDEPPGEDSLRAHWGRQYERKMLAARRAYAAFIDSDQNLHAIADQLGEAPLMDLLAKVGSAIGEDSITARADAGSEPRSPGEAMAEIARLQRSAKTDREHPYVNKLHPEHGAIVKRMEDLFALAYGA